MKTTQKRIKKTLLVGALVLSLGGITGCNSTNKSEEKEDNKKIVELQPNELSLEETKALKVGDVIPEGKEVNRELLEQQGMDFLYVYHTYEMNDGNLLGDMYTYSKLPSQEEGKMVSAEANGETIAAYYKFFRKEIVNVEFVKDETGVYKKKLILDNNMMELVDVIDENNIDKDKVKTLK